ncbi:hypothetical protein KCU81_g7214, partial [Aureobasidium melanogenum]|uniref:F-box domain-containing protein n=1 Tax=Aureobasidium melanogenum (strain CBS 110374) TaxID=1043003 RepID=A0A074VLY4_AURM1
MASNAVTLPITHGALRVSRMIPGEVWSQILKFLAEKDLKAVVLAQCPAPDQAVRLFWEVITPQNNKLAVLYQKVAHNPQALANHVQSLTMNFEAPGEQLATCTLAFPCLQKLRIVHNVHYYENVFEKTHIHIKTLIGPALTHLDIGTPEHESDATKPLVDNFFQALTQCSNLHTLSIRVCVRDSLRVFARAMSTCCKLQVLVLDKYTENLVNSSTLKAIANLPKLTSLKINKLIDLPLVSLISDIKTPFEALTSLELSIGAEAAVSLLPRTQQLRSLRLTIHGNKSIFPTFLKLPLLEHLELSFQNFTLTGVDYKQLVHLSNLTHLGLCSAGEEGASGLNTENVCALFLVDILSGLTLLQHFRLAANDTFDDEFLVALGRRCANLSSLRLSGAFELVGLCNETEVVFPSWQHLEIGDVTTKDPWMDEGAENTLANNIARAVRTHAPCLMMFHASEELDENHLLASKVERAWKIDWNVYGTSPYFHHLQFPSLQSFSVRLCENGPLSPPHLNQFIEPQLKHVIVEDHPTIATLGPGQTIFNHLTTLHTGMDGAAARELFPHMPTITDLGLYVDHHDGIVDWLAYLPRLRSLELIARAHILLTTRYLRGLQNLSLSMLSIHGEGGSGFNGHMITANDIDTLFGSHRTLISLEVAWEGDSRSANNPSFLQYSPHLLVERVATHYPALETLILPAPCAAIDLGRLPARALRSKLQYLQVERVAAPTVNPITRPVEYRTAILSMACKLIKHFPRLLDLMSNQDEDVVDEVFRDFETMRRAGLARR